MKLLRRHSEKGKRFEFHLHVEKLTVAPSLYGALAVQWQRGGKRSGQTKPTQPDSESAPVTYQFCETLTIPATLYVSGSGYASKTVNIFIAQVDDKGKELNVWGGLELDLADFAQITGKARQEYPIECSVAIMNAAGGRPKLTMTISAVQEGSANAAVAASKSHHLAEDSELAGSIDDVPSTLSTDDEEGGGHSRPSSRGGAKSRQSVGGSTALDAVPEGAAAAASNDYHDNIKDTGSAVGSATRSVKGPSRAQAIAAATGLLGVDAVAPQTATEAAYDSDGFLVDSEDIGGGSGGGGGLASVSKSVINNYTINDDLSSADTSRIKRNLGSAMDGAEPTPPGSTATASVVAGANTTNNNNLNTNTKPEKATMTASSYGSPSPNKSVDEDDSTKPRHARRFSREGGSALGSRSWAWKRQSNNSNSGGGGDDDDATVKKSQNSAGVVPVMSGLSFLSTTTGRETSLPAESVGGGGGGNGANTPVSNTGMLAATSGGAVTPSSPSMAQTMLLHELRVAAALEHSVYQAGRSWNRSGNGGGIGASASSNAGIRPSPSPAKERRFMLSKTGSFGNNSSKNANNSFSSRPAPPLESQQAPARRIARTVVVLGRDGGGAAFGLQALDAIRASADASLGDIHRVSLWWSTAVTLRFSFWGLVTNGGHFAWLNDAVLPAVRDLEAELFAAMLDQMWDETLEAAAAATVDASSSSSGTSGGGPLVERTSSTLTSGSSSNNNNVASNQADQSNSNIAAACWLRGLQAADSALSNRRRPASTPRPLFSLLRRQLMTCLMTRLDSTLTANVLLDTMSTTIKLDDCLLLCPRSQLTFLHGVELKMALGRMSNWAADAGIKTTVDGNNGGVQQFCGKNTTNDSPTNSVDTSTTATTAAHATAGPFPKLRAVADLLMVPKDSLVDGDVRAAVAPCLSAAEICRVLQLYKPDQGEASSDRFSDRLVKQLKAEASADDRNAAAATATAAASSSPGNTNTTSAGTSLYVGPDESILLEQAIIKPLSLDMSADSDDELSALENTARRASPSDQRHALLGDLWRGKR